MKLIDSHSNTPNTLIIPLEEGLRNGRVRKGCLWKKGKKVTSWKKEKKGRWSRDSLSDPTPRRPPSTSPTVHRSTYSTPQPVCGFVSYILNTPIFQWLDVKMYSFRVYVCISEQYRYYLMRVRRVRRDVDLHRPVTRGKRPVELSNCESTVHRTHSYPSRPRHFVSYPSHTHDCFNVDVPDNSNFQHTVRSPVGKCGSRKSRLFTTPKWNFFLFQHISLRCVPGSPSFSEKLP